MGRTRNHKKTADASSCSRDAFFRTIGPRETVRRQTRLGVTTAPESSADKVLVADRLAGAPEALAQAAVKSIAERSHAAVNACHV
jgi:hypothetical protein